MKRLFYWIKEKLSRSSKPFVPTCVYCKEKSSRVTMSGWFDPITQGIICDPCVAKIYGCEAKKRLVPLVPGGVTQKVKIGD